MLSFLAQGLLLGISAGFAPGPLLALVVGRSRGALGGRGYLAVMRLLGLLLVLLAAVLLRDGVRLLGYFR